MTGLTDGDGTSVLAGASVVDTFGVLGAEPPIALHGMIIGAPTRLAPTTLLWRFAPTTHPDGPPNGPPPPTCPTTPPRRPVPPA